MRKHSKGFFTKLLMILLALTFVLWGVGDIIRGSNNTNVLEVGDQKFSANEIVPIFRNQIAMMEARLQYKFKPEELKDPQLISIITNQIVNKILLEKAARDMKLFISDEMVKYEIAATPLFMSNGKFNKDLFDRFLRENNKTEASLIQSLKEEMPIRNLATVYSVLRFDPSVVKQALYNARSQIRSVELITVSPDVIKMSSAPSKEELMSIYKANDDIFSIPETRDISYVSFDSSIVSSTASITDEQIKAEYDAKKKFFSEPEKRKVSQMLFKTKSDAEDALAKLKSGHAFSDVAKEVLPAQTNLSMGDVSRGSFSEEIESVIFATNTQGYTNVIQSPMGYHIFYIESVTPERTPSFEELKSKIAQELKMEATYSRLNGVIQDIEQISNSGASLDQIAQKYNLKISKESGISKNGDTKKLFESNIAFATNEGSLSGVTPYPLSAERFIVLAVDKVYPKASKPYESVEKDVTAIWHASEKARLLKDYSVSLYKDLIDGKLKFEDAAKRSGISSKKVSLKQASTGPDLSEDLVTNVFSSKKMSITEPTELSNGNFSIAMVIDIQDADPTKFAETNNQLSIELINDVSNEVYVEMLNSLRKKYPVSIDQKFFESGNYF
ncbi:MAG: SurA N-terminal domain-containing protein [Alphaproteobacteria bacterium]|nr:SurA N-terminal domain-containing protein [Candidatus Jidaibacter sp.]